MVLGGRPVGNLYLTDKIGAPRFSMADQRLVETFARQAAMAIHTARLHDGLAALALLQERERIGRDLHDGIIQALYGVGLSLEDVPELMATDRAEAEARVDRAIDSIHAAIRDIRGFIFGLRTDELRERGPGGRAASAWPPSWPAARTMTIDVRRRRGARARPDRRPARAAAGPRGAQQRRTTLGRRQRHRDASSVTPHGLEMRIADDGHGFDLTAAGEPGHQGIGNMRSRASSMGGTLDVISIIGHGHERDPAHPRRHRATQEVERVTDDRDPAGSPVTRAAGDPAGGCWWSMTTRWSGRASWRPSTAARTSTSSPRPGTVAEAHRRRRPVRAGPGRDGRPSARTARAWRRAATSAATTRTPGS